MIEAVMLVTLGFLTATLLALAVVPALARRADRLARKRAEAAFPLSLAEIAADRDHLRAELALRERGLEQQAERGFAAKASAMQEVGRRDMTIGQLERDLHARDATIADLEADLAATRTTLAQTQDRLAGEIADHAETGATLEKRLADLAEVEHSLAETRTALTGTSSDLSARSSELDQEREMVGRLQALLSQREAELVDLRAEVDGLRLSQIESRTQILVLESRRDELSSRLAVTEQELAIEKPAHAAMIVDRDSERLRADALSARAMQAEAGLAAANAASADAMVEARRIDALLKQESVMLAEQISAREAAEQALSDAVQARHDAERRHEEERLAMHEDLREREQRLETLHAEIQMLQGALAEARTDRERIRRASLHPVEPASAAGQSAANAALRQEIVKVAERLMTLAPKQEAAE